MSLPFSDISKLLDESNSDKNIIHNYGFFYDMIFNSLVLKLKRPLNICEIGVSKTEQGSLPAWDKSDIINSIVGVDTQDLQETNLNKLTFYKADAYTHECVDLLKRNNHYFDIIIDNGSHNVNNQVFFFDHYPNILNDDGLLICEDVYDFDLIADQCKAGAYLIDGWANKTMLPANFEDPGLHYHDERLLIKSKNPVVRKTENTRKFEKKPHILRLPIVDFQEYNVYSKELAVSIPLFYSKKDSPSSDFDINRFQNIHCKGAIWAAMSLIHNSDLGYNGVPFYFHIEDKVWDYAIPMFEKFKVPENLIRKINVPDEQTETYQYEMTRPNFGKKYIPLLDKTIDQDILLILDSDAFTLAENQPISLYKDLTNSMLKNQPSMTYCFISKKRYDWWISVYLWSVGLPEDLMKGERYLNKLEERVYRKLGFEKPRGRNIRPDDLVPRYWAENCMVTFPKNHPVIEYTIDKISTCYCSPYIHAIWNEFNQPFLHLNDIINLPVYDFEESFIQGKRGYNCLAHLRSDHNAEYSRINDLYPKFYSGITKNII